MTPRAIGCVSRGLALALALTAPVPGCKKGAPVPAQKASANAVPTVRAESEGQLFTWIDDKGDFHVATSLVDVPLMGKDTVRVADPNQEVPGEDQVFVVDLRQARADGSYPVRTMARTDFEAIAVARRQQAGPTLVNTASPPAPEPTGSPRSTAAGGAPSRPAAYGTVVIYGAEWCGACHEAARYLRRKGVSYVEKDVEKDPGAAAEMQQKLTRNSLRAGSIPVIDVRGKVVIGFNASEIDAALGEAL